MKQNKQQEYLENQDTWGGEMSGTILNHKTLVNEWISAAITRLAQTPRKEKVLKVLLTKEYDQIWQKTSCDMPLVI